MRSLCTSQKGGHHGQAGSSGSSLGDVGEESSCTSPTVSHLHSCARILDLLIRPTYGALWMTDFAGAVSKGQTRCDVVLTAGYVVQQTAEGLWPQAVRLGLMKVHTMPIQSRAAKSGRPQLEEGSTHQPWCLCPAARRQDWAQPPEIYRRRPLHLRHPRSRLLVQVWERGCSLLHLGKGEPAPAC